MKAEKKRFYVYRLLTPFPPSPPTYYNCTQMNIESVKYSTLEHFASVVNAINIMYLTLKILIIGLFHKNQDMIIK